MLFFLFCAVIALLVAAALVAPLLRARGEAGAESSAVTLYRAQLAEVDRDLARGTLAPEEAERTRAEVARRLIAADAEGRHAAEAPRGATRLAAAACVVLVAGGGGALYAALGAVDAAGPYPDIPRAARIAIADEMRAARPSQAEAEAAAPAEPALPDGAETDYSEMVARLRATVPTRPEDRRGWELLARHEAALGRFAAARAAQGRLLDLKGTDATPEDHLRLAELMVSAADGFVSPEAEAHLRAAMEVDPDHPVALYYLGLLYAQTDRPDVAFRLWQPVAEGGDADSPYTRLARAQIAEAAFRAGLDYTLPGGAAPAPGPTAEDLAAARDLSPEEVDARARGMVAQLSARLADGGGPAADWARLIRSLGVLGETAQARPIHEEALQVFAGDAEALALIEAAARDAGLR